MCIDEKMKHVCGNLKLPVFWLVFALILVWIFAGSNVVHGNDDKAITSKEEYLLETPPDFSWIDLSDDEWIPSRGFLSTPFDKPQFDPVESIHRVVSTLYKELRFIDYCLFGISFITAILVMRSFVQRRRVFKKLEKIHRDIKDSSMNKDSRHTYAMELIQQDIREVNENSIAARMQAERASEICRELSNFRLTSVVCDLIRAGQTVEGIADTLNVTVVHIQQILENVENELNKIVKNYTTQSMASMRTARMDTYINDTED